MFEEIKGAEMFEEVKAEKVYMKVVKQIRELIERGRLNPGDKLPPEKVLAEKMGVSRPSVREAIVALEILGLVKTKGGKGSFIKKISSLSVLDEDFRHIQQQDSPFELLEARRIIEPEVAGHAAQRAQPEDIAAMKQSLENMSHIERRLSVSQEYEQFFKFDNTFHINVARAAHNTELLRMLAHLIDSSNRGLSMKFKEKVYGTRGRPKKYLKEHGEILAAIEDRNREIARRRMHQHLAGCEKDWFGEM